MLETQLNIDADMKKQLEILLEQLEDVENPSVAEEQYSTPPPLAAELLTLAFLHGDIANRVVYDLGSGNGILAIGAKLLGAKEAIGIERDGNAIEVAIENSRKLGVEVEFRRCDVRTVRARGDTVVMNPPFGAQRGNRHADRVFLKKAFEIASVVYTIHNAGSEPFLRTFVHPASITRFPTSFGMRRRFWFHKREKKTIAVDLYRMNL